jgi:hypothetical protein
MPVPPDYWPDARRLPKELLPPFVNLIRKVRDECGLSNADLCREVRGLIAAHNDVVGRKQVPVKAISMPWEYDEQGKYELNAMQKGTRKYLVGYLAWLCKRDEAIARTFYEEAGLEYRPYRDDIEELEAPEENAHRLTWAQLIDAHTHFGNVEIVSLRQRSLGLIDFMHQEPVLKRKIKLGEPFCFRLQAANAGYVIAFQRPRRRWYPMPLAAGAMHDKIGAGRHALPRDSETGDPVPLSEDADPGEYGFGFLVSDNEGLPELAARFRPREPLADSLAIEFEELLGEMPAANRVFFRLNVMIES